MILGSSERFGRTRIEGAPKDAQVWVDGYYVGVVNDFSGATQHMNLEAGPHHVEIRMAPLDASVKDSRRSPANIYFLCIALIRQLRIARFMRWAFRFEWDVRG